MNKRCQLILLIVLLFFSLAQAQIEKYQQAMQHYNGEKGFSPSMDSLKGIEIPTFSGTTMLGRKVELHKLKGKVVVLNFWFIGCAPCRAEIPGLNQIADVFKEEPVEFISIAKETKEQLDKKFFSKHEFKFETIPDPEERIFKDLLQLKGYPTTIVIDKQGLIQLMIVGGKIVEEVAVEEIKSKLIPVITACLNKN